MMAPRARNNRTSSGFSFWSERTGPHVGAGRPPGLIYNSLFIVMCSSSSTMSAQCLITVVVTSLVVSGMASMASENAQTKVIWRFMGRVLSDPSDPDAVDGREYFFKFADADGQLRKPGHVEIVTNVAKAMFMKSGVLDKLVQSSWKYVSSINPSLSDLQDEVTKRPEFLEFKNQFCSKFEDLVPIVAQFLSRFFGNILYFLKKRIEDEMFVSTDFEGNDVMSQDEFIAEMSFLKSAEFQLSFQSIKLEPSVQAVFRLLDQNGDGKIEPAELTAFSVELITLIANLVINYLSLTLFF
jgi:hypothetical protein